MDNNFDEKNIIKSSIKVFHLLEVLIEHKNLSITRLSELTGYSRSTTQRIANTLKHLKYIDQDMFTFEYFPTLKLFELGSNVVNNATIRNVAKSHLLKLYNEVNETINLGILDNTNVVYLDKIVSKSPLRVELELGIKVPLYCSSLGKAIAAFNDEVISFGSNYIKYTKKTISSDEELYENLAQVKKLGYALDNEEYVSGLICIGVPILNSSGKAIASISISKPAIRFNKEDIGYYANLLKQYAIDIQNDML